MITTKTINELLCDIYHEGVKVGWMAKVKGGYDIEINYCKVFIEQRHKSGRLRFINKLLRDMKGREVRSLQPLRKYSDMKILI